MVGAALLVIGGGNMARAIVRGGIDAEVLEPERVVVVEPEEGKRREFASWGCAACEGAERAIALTAARAGTGGGGGAGGVGVLLAVKPQSLPEVSRDFGSRLDPGATVFSILAGTPTGKLAAMLPGAKRFVRLMPNTPAQVGLGMTAVCAGPGAREADLEFGERLFAALGKVVRIDESLMDAFTAVAGSGPAYVFYLAEAMTKAAVELGFGAEEADAAVRQTIVGAATLLARSELPPTALRSQVTSKGGTTAAATSVLDAAGVQEAFVRAIAAARDRGRELAEG